VGSEHEADEPAADIAADLGADPAPEAAVPEAAPVAPEPAAPAPPASGAPAPAASGAAPEPGAAGAHGLPPEPDPGPEDPERRPVTELRKPSTLGGVIYLCVLAAAVAGVIIAATGPWRTGVSWLAFALLAAAVARLVLPDHDAGMLRVRNKALDATILIAMGIAILVLAGTIPDQPV
jgi:hypothetical protein